jgi:peptide/nickel transport system substrate-binding protein
MGKRILFFALFFFLIALGATLSYFYFREEPAPDTVATVSDEALKEARKATLTLRLSAEPSTLNNLTYTTPLEKEILQSHLYPPLLRFDPDSLEPVPEIAESLPMISPDHRTLTFTLRHGIHFTDGTELTAEDFRYTYQLLSDPECPAAAMRDNFKELTAVEAVDPYTVRFQFKQPLFRSVVLAGIDFPVLPKHIVEGTNAADIGNHPIGKSPVGYGPYKLVEWKTGEEIIFERNDEYWAFQTPQGKRRNNFEKIRYRVVPDFEEAYQLLQGGGLDVLTIGPEQVERAVNDKALAAKYQLLGFYPPFYNYIGWNNSSALFEDPSVRRAMTQMVRRQEVLDQALKGRGKIQTCCFYINSKEYSPNLIPLPFDPQKARELLDGTGWIDSDGDGIRDKGGEPFRFELLTTTGQTPWRTMLETDLQKDLKSIGIECKVTPLAWPALLDRIRSRNFDAFLIGIVPTPAMADPYDIWHSYRIAPEGQNYVGYRNMRVDRILEEARAEFDTQKRIANYRMLNEIIDEEQPWTFLYTMPTLIAVNRNVKDVRVHNLGIRPEEWFIPAKLREQG